MSVNSKTTSVMAWLLVICATLASQSPLAGEDSQHESDVSVPETIQLTDLPEPPAELADWIQTGNVRFFVGQRPPESPGDGANDGRAKRKLAAETHFQLSFDYRSRTKWQIQKSEGTSKLLVTARFAKIKLARKHDVWFRKRPDAESFWNNRLVLHEFDHVRLSSEPGVEKRFTERLLAENVISQEIDSNARVTDAMVRKAVSDHVTRIFNDTVALVNIRYQELDRQTSNGIRPLPEDSSLSEWLR